jgi:signal peptidase I
LPGQELGALTQPRSPLNEEESKLNGLVLVAVFIAIAFVVQTAVIRAAVCFSDSDRRDWKRAAKVTAARLALALMIFLLILIDDHAHSCLILVMGLAIDSLLTIWLLRRWLQTRMCKVIRAWFTQGICNVVASLVLFCSADQCFASYLWPNSSMSPNIRGYHLVEDLPDGTHLINAATNPWQDWPAPGTPSGGIVAETYEYVERPRPEGFTHTADRFLCNKMKTPARCDAIVFMYPRDTSLKYVKRLVGLPGERITIRDGSAWVNNTRLVPPARLGPIRYEVPTHFGGPIGARGDREDMFVVTLADDEYFVLGDHTHKSADSRTWGPVNRNLIVGVVDLIYWPPSRWRLNP